jgi:Fur family ferric uptake transcriptional regulator
MTDERTLSLVELCVQKGMRMTEQRRVIASVIEQASEEHPDVEELYRRSVAIDPKISISTVYRTVKLFEDAGMVERHDFRDGRSRYETVPDEHHDHLIDLRSGQVIEFRTRKSRPCRSSLLKSWATSWWITGWNYMAFRSIRKRAGTPMAEIKAVLTILVLTVVSLILIPLQWVAVKMNLPIQKHLPHLWHKIATGLVGIRIHQDGQAGG